MFGKEWTLRVILELRRVNTIRYNDLLESLEGISTSTLSTTLKNLQKSGVIKRRSSGKNPPFKVEYSLTERGFGFVMALYPLLKWVVKKQSMPKYLIKNTIIKN